MRILRQTGRCALRFGFPTLCFLLTVHLHAAAFLKLDGIDGEATDDKHKDWINLLSVQMGAQEGAASGGRQHKPLVVTKPVDKSSPLLMEAFLTGEMNPHLQIEFVEDAGGRFRYFHVVLEGVLVAGMTLEAGLSAEPVPTETLSLNYDKIEWTYVEFDTAQTPDFDHTVVWEVLRGKADYSVVPSEVLKFRGTSRLANGGMEFEWMAESGKTYQILGSRNVGGPYDIQVETVLIDTGGIQSFSLPTDLPLMFLIVMESAP